MTTAAWKAKSFKIKILTLGPVLVTYPYLAYENGTNVIKSIFYWCKKWLQIVSLIGPNAGDCDFEPLGDPLSWCGDIWLRTKFLFKSILALQFYSIYDFCFQVPEDPFFFCNDCFRQFNYSPKNEKVGNFKAYPFIDVNALWSVIQA